MTLLAPAPDAGTETPDPGREEARTAGLDYEPGGLGAQASSLHSPFSWGLCVGGEWASREPPLSSCGLAWGSGEASGESHQVSAAVGGVCLPSWWELRAPNLTPDLSRLRPAALAVSLVSRPCGQGSGLTGTPICSFSTPTPCSKETLVTRSFSAEANSQAALSRCWDSSTNMTDRNPGLPRLSFQASAVQQHVGRRWSVLGTRRAVGGHHRRGAVEDLKWASLDEERSFPFIYF